jgi:hypothetical protein
MKKKKYMYEFSFEKEEVDRIKVGYIFVVAVSLTQAIGFASAKLILEGYKSIIESNLISTVGFRLRVHKSSPLGVYEVIYP